MQAHKVWSTLIAIVILYGGYHLYGVFTAPSTATRYITTNVATGTVVATMSETGQVSASQQLSLASKAGGQVLSLYVTPGQHVVAGQSIAQLDSTDARQALQSAQLSLQNQELSYQQTTSSSTLALNLFTAQNSVVNAQTSLQKTHDASYASIASIYSNLSSVLNSLDHVLHDSNATGRPLQQNIDAYADTVGIRDNNIPVFKNSAQVSYDAAVAAHNTALVSYKATTSLASNDDLVALADETYTATKMLAEAVKNTHDFFDRVNTDYTFYNLGSDSALTTLLATIDTDTTTVNSDLSTVLTIKSNIVSSEQTLAQAQNTLETTQGGANTLTVQSAALALRQAQNAVSTAEQNLSYTTVTAPFSGTVAALSIQRYQTISNGTTVATMVSDNQNVNISVNEVDAAKLAVGQKAMISFDALPNVTIAGTVSSVNSIGTVSQGVVSYSAVVTFDTPNASVKSGMSATVDIVTGTATGLVVPSSAVKGASGQNYVQVFDPPLPAAAVAQAGASGISSAVAPARVPVVTGLSGDSSVIVTSGLTEGAQVVVQTIAGTAITPSPAAQSTSLFGGTRAGGAATGGGNAVRILGR